MSDTCFICLDSGQGIQKTPCGCKDSWVHEKCLSEWIATSNSMDCHVCLKSYVPWTRNKILLRILILQFPTIPCITEYFLWSAQYWCLLPWTIALIHWYRMSRTSKWLDIARHGTDVCINTLWCIVLLMMSSEIGIVPRPDAYAFMTKQRISLIFIPPLMSTFTTVGLDH